jgi:hypothetical protein
VTDAPGQPPEDGDDADDSASDEPRREHASDESFPASDAPQWWSGEPDDADK